MAVKSNLDPRIIFLARDPRGILQSKIDHFTSGGYSQQNRSQKISTIISGVGSVCSFTQSMLGQIESDHWLRERTKVVRYEDLAMEPVNKAKEVLKHARMSFSSDVASWIESNTHSSPPSDMPTEEAQFITQRDSKQTALRWREKISMQNVEAVQDMCAEEMQQLGYLQIHGSVNNQSNVITDFDNFT